MFGCSCHKQRKSPEKFKLNSRQCIGNIGTGVEVGQNGWSQCISFRHLLGICPSQTNLLICFFLFLYFTAQDMSGKRVSRKTWNRQIFTSEVATIFVQYSLRNCQIFNICDENAQSFTSSISTSIFCFLIISEYLIFVLLLIIGGVILHCAILHHLSLC